MVCSCRFGLILVIACIHWLLSVTIYKALLYTPNVRPGPHDFSLQSQVGLPVLSMRQSQLGSSLLQGFCVSQGLSFRAPTISMMSALRSGQEQLEYCKLRICPRHLWRWRKEGSVEIRIMVWALLHEDTRSRHFFFAYVPFSFLSNCKICMNKCP